MKICNLLILLIFNSLILSCKSESEKIAERNAAVDSTIILLQKKLYANNVDSIVLQNQFNGEIVITRNNEILYQKENGLENFEQKTKLDSNSIFAIGSLSKQFTAVLVVQLEEQGKLKTSDKVSKYLTEFQTKELEKITIHQLLNHTSGINDFGSGLISEPGKAFNYSNKGYRFLGKLIEKTSGKSFGENAKDLFQKAGMLHTSTPQLFSENQNFAGANLGTLSKNQMVENMPKRLAEDDISVSAGGILSTVNDLQHWNQSLFGGKILQSKSLAKMLEKSTSRKHPILGNVGYGYGMMMNLAAPKSYFHTGYVKGSPSLLVYYPETKTSVVILSNIADESKGKEAIFLPHSKVKTTTDAIENAVSQVQKEMLKKAD